MRPGGALLALAFFVAAVAAEDNANILPGETNGDAHSVAGSIGQHAETDGNKEPKVYQDEGSSNNTAVDNTMNNSAEGTGMRRDELVQQPKDKDNNTSPLTDLLQDPLIKDCDQSHRCIIENKKFIACLKVPGEDSLALSLLAGNKGINPLDVSITAPDYVNLVQDTLHIEANNHNTIQMSFSSTDPANNTAIVLKVAKESCNINIHRAIARTTGPVIRMRLTPTYMLVPVFVLLGVVGVCIKLRRSHKQDSSSVPAYQNFGTSELPVSTGGKKEADQSDQWDDNWGDDWDDVEAPVTPSKPMPNPSSKGLSSRRLPKDGWKD